MSFTFEKENNNKLAFLDIDVIRDETGKTFKTSLNRKPTFSGVYNNIKSFLSIKYKYSLISSIVFRVFPICSDYEMISEEIEKLKIIWLINKFPKRGIGKLVFQFFNKLFIPKIIIHTVAKNKLFISLEYTGCPIKNMILRKFCEVLSMGHGFLC